MPDMVRSFFSIAMQTDVGDGANTMFWTDRWLHGQRIMDMAPHFYTAVPKRRANRRTVKEAITDGAWIQDIHGALSVRAILEYLQV